MTGPSCLAVIASPLATQWGAVESVPASAISFEKLVQAELREAHPFVVRILELADRFVHLGVKYRRLRSARRLSRRDLARPLSRLSCSEFVWVLCSLAGLDMGEHPISSRRLAFGDCAYPRALCRVTDGSIRPGDLLVYEYPAEERAGPRRTPGKIGHVVIVVSVEERIVVGSHGRESTPRGERRGPGYRRLPAGWGHWSEGRTLKAKYRVAGNGA